MFPLAKRTVWPKNEFTYSVGTEIASDILDESLPSSIAASKQYVHAHDEPWEKNLDNSPIGPITAWENLPGEEEGRRAPHVR
jgi:hypothetical protein